MSRTPEKLDVRTSHCNPSEIIIFHNDCIILYCILIHNNTVTIKNDRMNKYDHC